MNHMLLLEQCANLQLILDEVKSDPLAETFSKAMKKYLESQNRLLQKYSETKQK